MTWKEFVAGVEKSGVKDDWQIEIVIDADAAFKDIRTELVRPRVDNDFDAVLIFNV